MALALEPVSRLPAPEAGILAGGTGVLGAAWVLPGLWSRGINPMPPCLFHAITGLPCPFCGGTRSFAAMAHGNLVGAAHVYPLGPLLFAGLLIALAVAAYTLASGRRLRIRLDRAVLNRILIVAVVVLALNWGAKLIFLGY